MEPNTAASSRSQQIFSCAFYGLSSIVIMMSNKVVLTSFGFPSFQMVGLSQMVAAVVILWSCRELNYASFPPLSRDTTRKVMPLPLFYIGNVLFGLGGTQHMSLPMFTVIRRFTILFTMLGELLVFKTRPSVQVQLSVLLMIGGSIIAALNDLSFDFYGYLLALLANICTAAGNVYVKKKLDSKDLGKSGLIYYNALFSLLPTLAIAFGSGQFGIVGAFDKWSRLDFLVFFALSAFMGLILNYSMFLCTHLNSALTTTVTGTLKNIIVTYLGIFVGGDYVFTYLNFFGLNVSMAGSLLYTYVTFSEGQNRRKSAIARETVTTI